MDYHLQIKNRIDPDDIATIYARVFRKTHDECGYIVLSFDAAMSSQRLRKYMVDIKEGLSEKCKAAFNQTLDYYWLARFDQQKTTKFHRDNAPQDSYLMLGYEPTEVESQLLFADYSQLIDEYGLSADQYYELHNPIFKPGEQLLAPYVNEAENFRKEAYTIVFINNSDLTSDKTLGVLHKAKIPHSDPNEPRIINSMMLYLKPASEARLMGKEEEMKFVATEEVSG